MEKKFLLKDMLFNRDKVEMIAFQIKSAYPPFNQIRFVNDCVSKFPELELKQRINHISSVLKTYLPANYLKAINILISSLPPELDNKKTDNDFGEFIYSTYSNFVAIYGCSEKYLNESLNAMYEITKRFSAEDAIRYFINAFPGITMSYLLEWSRDENYHVRRLASEGTRPKLPWSQKLIINYRAPFGILDNLFCDSTRYVTRSVANHLNDISKIDPDTVVSKLKLWKEMGLAKGKEYEFIEKHSLRTLVKKGNENALVLLGYNKDFDIKNVTLELSHTNLLIGNQLEFQFRFTSVKKEKLLIDYLVYFQDKRGNPNNKKVFKLKIVEALPRVENVISKKISFKQRSTRKLYPGKHMLAIQINGNMVVSKDFNLVGNL